jgi:hypothetical protein
VCLEELAKNPRTEENYVLPSRRHRSQCKKLLKRELLGEDIEVDSFSSISSSDSVVWRHDSDGSLERLERGEGMILIT